MRDSTQYCRRYFQNAVGRECGFLSCISKRLPSLQHIDDDQSNVVVLSFRSGLPLTNLRQQLIQQLRGWARLIRTNDLFKLKLAKRIAEGIFGLTDAVSIKQETVTWEDGHVVKGVIGFRKHSEQQTIAFDAM